MDYMPLLGKAKTSSLKPISCGLCGLFRCAKTTAVLPLNLTLDLLAATNTDMWRGGFWGGAELH